MDTSFFIYALLVIVTLLIVGIPFTLITNKKYRKLKGGLLDKCDNAFIKRISVDNQYQANNVFDDRSKITSPEYSYLPQNVYNPHRR